MKREWDRLKDHVIWKLGVERGSQEFPRDVIGGHVVSEEQRRLALDCSQRRVGLGLVLMDADVILRRSGCG